jgi:hypothetical protein
MRISPFFPNTMRPVFEFPGGFDLLLCYNESKGDRLLHAVRVLVLSCLLLHGLWGAVPGIGAEPDTGPGRWRFGVQIGWAGGLGWEFDWHYRSSISDRTSLGLFLGALARYDVSDSFGLQLNLDFQFARNRWTFDYWNFPRESGETRFGITSVGFMPVWHVLSLERFRFFLEAGGGMSFGEWGEYGGFSDLYYHWTAGIGLRFSPSPAGSAPALVLGAGCRRLLDPESGIVRTADLIRFQLGVEF